MLLKDDTRRRLCRAREILADVRDTPVTIEDIADEIEISPFHFIRQFQSVFGATPHQFRIAQRIALAQRMLAQGNRTVTEVCMEVGFSSVGSFSALFARRVGETPSGYQRRARKMVVVPGIIPPALVPGCFSLMAYLPPEAFRSFREA